MYSILAVDPSFGGAYNVKRALSTSDKTLLICTHPDKWRQRPSGTIDYLLGSKGEVYDDLTEVAEVVRRSKFVFLVGGSALTVAQHLPGYHEWLPTLNTASWFTDSYYKQTPHLVNDWLAAMQCKQYFALPDGCYSDHYPKGTIPLHHCVQLGDVPRKPSELLVVHSPGTQTKRQQKKSLAIEAVVEELRAVHRFNYKCLMRLPHVQARGEIRRAHIHIDKLEGYSSGLGKSGLEGMAGGAVEMSAYEYSEGYFERPPLIELTTAASLHRHLERLVTMDRRSLLALGAVGRTWVEEYWGLENGAWLRYLERYVSL